MSEGHQHPPMASPARDVRKLKQNSAAAAGELKEFLAKIQGKSPKEMLGVVASSGLAKGLVQATIAMGVLILVLTIAPYAWSQMFGGSEGAPEVVEAAEAAEAAPAQPAEEPAETASAADPDVAVPPDEMPANIGDPATVIDTLGVGETKEAPANVNPLEGSADDLLDGLD